MHETPYSLNLFRHFYLWVFNLQKKKKKKKSLIFNQNHFIPTSQL